MRSTIVSDEFNKLLSVFAEFPNAVIGQLEKFPHNALMQIDECEIKLQSGELLPGTTINMPLSINIDDDVMNRYNIEFNIISSKYGYYCD